MVGRTRGIVTNIFVVGFAYCLAFAFLYSSAIHMGNQYAFLSHVYSYRILPERLSVVVATFLPCFQLNLGLALLFFPSLRSTGFLIASILLFVFAGLQTQALVRGLNISCGCFSSNHDPISLFTIGRTLFFFLISLIGFILASLSQAKTNQVVLPVRAKS